MGTVSKAEAPDCHAVAGEEPAVLARFFETEVNLVTLHRSASPALRAFSQGCLLKHAPCATETVVSQPDQLPGVLPESIAQREGAEALREDIEEVFALWSDLFDPARSGLRFRVLDQAMCPRFHIDRVMARLIVSYGESGTEWLPESSLDRGLLGKPLADPTVDPLARPEAIKRVPPFAIALLKGAAWPGNEARGIAHRSPHIKPPERRALLTLDMLD